jgi:hypothetical protein
LSEEEVLHLRDLVVALLKLLRGRTALLETFELHLLDVFFTVEALLSELFLDLLFKLGRCLGLSEI